MADAYLVLAERILLTSRRPMTPAEILDFGYAEEMVPWHLHGATQHKTLHARLSEDVVTYPEGSRFFRTAPGQFFLKVFQEDPTIPDSYKTTFFAPPRHKELKKEAVLAISSAELDLASDETNPISIDQLSSTLSAGRYVFRAWKELEKSEEFIPVHSFVVVHRRNEILSYRSGKFRPSSDPLYGKCSIGFGGAVLASDLDLVFDSFFGIVGNGIRELVSGIGLPRRLAEKARYKNQVRSQVATLVKGRSTRHIHVVLTYGCPNEFSPTKTALSLNDLRWISVLGSVNDINQYDPTSRFLFERNLIRRIVASEEKISY